MPGNTDITPYLQLMAACEAYNLGWLWWDWRMGLDDLTYDGIYGHWDPGGDWGTDHGIYGQAVVDTDTNSINNTSVRTAYQQAQSAP